MRELDLWDAVKMAMYRHDHEKVPLIVITKGRRLGANWENTIRHLQQTTGLPLARVAKQGPEVTGGQLLERIESLLESMDRG